MQSQLPYGVVTHEPPSPRATDYLYRMSLKCLVRNDAGEVLVVKEAGRTYWDLPGGGMDHGETIKQAIARELHEEASFTGNFTYRVIAVEDPNLIQNGSFWQIRFIFAITPDNFHVKPGIDSDEVIFINPTTLKDSLIEAERLVYEYSLLVQNKAE